MSKICKFCDMENADNATVCESCRAAFPGSEISTGPKTENIAFVWKIRCPVSGREYDVANENVRIESCECCDDDIDKREIAKQRPFKVLSDNPPPEKNAGCGEAPVPEEACCEPPVTAGASLVMTDLKSGTVITINGSGIIGRRGDIEPDFFAGDMFVSEFHCKLIAENGDFKIEPLPTTNPTKLNNVALSKGVRSTVRNGDYVTIADKVFEIAINGKTPRVDTAAAAAEPAARETEKRVRYTVTCPKCGTEYEVGGIDDRISECNNCDEYDRREIAGTGAKVKNAD